MNTNRPSISLPLFYASTNCYQRKSHNLLPTTIQLDLLLPHSLDFLNQLYLVPDKTYIEWSPKAKGVKRRIDFNDTQYNKIRKLQEVLNGAFGRLKLDSERNRCRIVRKKKYNKSVGGSKCNPINKQRILIRQHNKPIPSKPKIISIRWLKENMKRIRI